MKKKNLMYLFKIAIKTMPSDIHVIVVDAEKVLAGRIRTLLIRCPKKC